MVAAVPAAVAALTRPIDQRAPPQEHGEHDGDHDGGPAHEFRGRQVTNEGTHAAPRSDSERGTHTTDSDRVGRTVTWYADTI